MAILGSPLLPLGLLLCLWLLCSPASCTIHIAKCMPFSLVTGRNSSHIHVNPKVYESNALYTVSVHLNDNISSVVLEARDQHNSIIGSWQNASEYCDGSVKYDVKGGFRTLFEAKWISPNSTNITAVKIHVYTADFLRKAKHSSITLMRAGAPLAVTSHHLSTKHVMAPTQKPTSAHPKATTAQEKTTATHPIPTTTYPKLTTTHRTPATTPKLTTTPRTPVTFHPKVTTTHGKHTKSSANRAFLSPMKEAVQILLIFLISTLLF